MSSFSRKSEHLELARKAQVDSCRRDKRFNYEPLFAAHPLPNQPYNVTKPLLLGSKKISSPLWISSMTGGGRDSDKINNRLAHAANRFGLGMGMGSCRSLLNSTERLEDFQLRPILGSELPLFINLGVAQIEQLLASGKTNRINWLIETLDADGLIIHINPLQEALQPEGDRFTRPAIETISELLASANYPIIVKEVGQGFGPKSLTALIELPLAALEFGALGGTNFTRLEGIRPYNHKKSLQDLETVGHSATEMVLQINQILDTLGNRAKCSQFIISGGIDSFRSGYYLINTLNSPAIYGQAAAILEHAAISQESLDLYIQTELEGLALLNAFCSINMNSREREQL
ncbi:MAG: type 2 isopentenyl-diphosphate Delta-isomerase [Bdellovibrionales bacterium]|nr:type 2 isopentenyl-diphosphate Delta-isomerase [Bdellovibrionales bacterium]MBT3526626.1 type 2 isopentenyl-diphosphate Delta-isomerase [Bdellovibrionales bacterium]MBT7766646.1 type 2 isopentenyl-diphosphate Delta-isomerase [Bdellovibrionales bacterium]